MKHKIFRVNYGNGKFHYIVSYNGWAGLIPFVEVTQVEYRNAITLREASIWEVIKYIIKGV